MPLNRPAASHLVPVPKKQPKTIPKQFFFSLNLGPAINQYQQTGKIAEVLTTDIKTTLLVARLTLTYLLYPSRWSLNAGGHASLFSLKTEPATESLKYFGGSGGMTYVFPWPEKPWQLNCSGGFFYETTTASGAYGFVNLYGPESGLSLKYSFQGGHHIRLFGKYSAVMGKNPTFNIKNLRKLQMGGAVGFVVGGGSVLTLSLEQTQHTLEFTDASIRNRAIGFGISFGL